MKTNIAYFVIFIPIHNIKTIFLTNVSKYVNILTCYYTRDKIFGIFPNFNEKLFQPIVLKTQTIKLIMLLIILCN